MASRTTRTLVGSVLLLSCSSSPEVATIPDPTDTSSPAATIPMDPAPIDTAANARDADGWEVLWEAGHETGDASEWDRSQSGAIFNSGTGTVEWTDEVAHSGAGSLALSVRRASGQTQAARIFRWAENPSEAYYSAWFYFPELVEPDRWWNILQFKSKLDDHSDPTWVVNVGNDSAGAMRLYLYDAVTETSHHEPTGPEPIVIPVRRWTHIEVFLRQATDDSGRISLWQDGEMLYDLGGVQTTLADNVQWSLNNYSDGLDPEDVTIFVDDAAIALERQGARP